MAETLVIRKLLGNQLKQPRQNNLVTSPSSGAAGPVGESTILAGVASHGAEEVPWQYSNTPATLADEKRAKDIKENRKQLMKKKKKQRIPKSHRPVQFWKKSRVIDNTRKMKTGRPEEALKGSTLSSRRLKALDWIDQENVKPEDLVTATR